LTQNPAEETTQKEIMMKVTKYITDRYGSVFAFLLLKYLLEHKLAREKEGYTVYELAFKIAPSVVLTRKTLIKIECRADGSDQTDSEKGLELLVQKGIVEIDLQTDIVELKVPINTVANVYLRNTDKGFEVVPDMSTADVILLPTHIADFPVARDAKFVKASVSGVPDVLLNNQGQITIVGIKYWQF